MSSKITQSVINNYNNVQTKSKNNNLTTQTPKISIENQSDSFESKKQKNNRNKIITGSIIGTVISLIGFAYMAKIGKLGSKCQEFINDILKPLSKVKTEAGQNNSNVKISKQEDEKNLSLLFEEVEPIHVEEFAKNNSNIISKNS